MNDGIIITILIICVTCCLFVVATLIARQHHHPTASQNNQCEIALMRVRAELEAKLEERDVVRRYDMPPQTLRVSVDPNADFRPPSTYPEIGFLKSTTSSGVMPLYGQQSLAHKYRYYYYTVLPNSGIKVSVLVKTPQLMSGGRDCMDDMGCNELYDGDVVQIPDLSVGEEWVVKKHNYNRW